MADQWSDTESEDTPVRWEDAGNGSNVKWTTFDNAVRRLVAYGYSKHGATEALRRGETLRTAFAFYSLPYLRRTDQDR